MYISLLKAWAFHLYRPRNCQSFWHTIALSKLSECVKDRLRPVGGVSLMSSGRSLDFILYICLVQLSFGIC